jgi:hypothetical protein
VEVYSQQFEKNVYGFAREVPSVCEPKARYLSKITFVHTRRSKNFRKIEELQAIELLPHPAFSPNLEPSDYYLFRSMAQFLRGKML